MVGERIKKLREEKGISQTDLAIKIGESKQTLYKYETGKITNIPSDKIELIADVLGCSPGYLMGWEENKADSTRNEEFVKLFENADPVLQESVVNILKSTQPKS